MKAVILSLLIFLMTADAYAKSCKAILNGRIKKEEIEIPAPHVFYPDDEIHSRYAKWVGKLQTVAFEPPMAIDIECGKPFFTGSFDSFTGTGYLPQIIETLPWVKTGWDGKPKVVEAEQLYGWGDSYTYPYPPVKFDGKVPMFINEPAPPGVKDICDVQKLELPDMTFPAEIEPDPFIAKYVSTTSDGQYRWDNTKSPKGIVHLMELQDPYITIVCDDTWTYELEMEWPYKVEADHDSLCGAGSVMRKMNVKGTFTNTEDNKVVGFIDVPLPTVTYSGSLWGTYHGSGFSTPVSGFHYNDSEGNAWVDLEIPEDGHGTTWSYSATCPYGVLTGSLFGAVHNYFQIYNSNETMSETNSYHIKLKAGGDEREFNVDMDGQGIVTFRRKWTKK